jgi:hypothetical protein
MRTNLLAVRIGTTWNTVEKIMSCINSREEGGSFWFYENSGITESWILNVSSIDNLKDEEYAEDLRKVASVLDSIPDFEGWKYFDFIEIYLG